MKNNVRVGYIGLGRRGMAVLKQNLVDMRDVEIVTLCDLSESRCREASELVLEKMGKTPAITLDYHDIISDPTIDAVFIMTGWGGRPEMAMEAMRPCKRILREGMNISISNI